MTSTLVDTLPELAIPAAGEDQPDLQLLLLNEPLAASLGLDPDWLRAPAGIRFLAGHDGGHALAYAGHQFGQYNPIMGDGRALLLGAFGGFEVQAKGTGRTPFSKSGDGRGPLDAMLREYLVSEFMHACGIPTTRGLAVLSTGRHVQRQLVVPAGISVRVAQSHLRVGTFELVRRSGAPELFERLQAYVWERFPGGLAGVVSRQSRTVAGWMGVGFVHGVMNTDNCTISGETIDYGPCAFLDVHDPAACFSSIDSGRRYAYGRQPAMLQWNLMRLAECLGESFEFETVFSDALQEVFATKLGTDDPARINEWLSKLPGQDHTLAHAELLGPNPQVIPRNYWLQKALDEALGGDLGLYRELLAAVQAPFCEPTEDRFREPGPVGPGFVTYCGT
ncbi:protein adenylyltransferase SelO family protein [Staphylococcus chromogenes]|nr:protein adenylyltransferase SelO family protein [Staphylococcus chromogenes]